MAPIRPASAEELADLLRDTAAQNLPITILGANSKRLMAGPQRSAGTVFSTSGLGRILQYEPNDLTVSVEAGTPWSQLQKTVSRRGQMIALDPPFWDQATVGGVVASNSSGPLRRAFGTARDLVIGMRFAMLNGQLVQVGGMVVKNVAGLDIGKLMIGSFGTLAVLTSVNFRLHAAPEETRTFLFSFQELEGAIARRDSLLASVLRPLSIDLLTPPAAARFDRRGYVLAIRAGGSTRVLARYVRELSAGEQLSGSTDEQWWQRIREYPADFLRRQPSGVILRISTTLADIHPLLGLVSGAGVSRAGSGVTYVYFTGWAGVSALQQKAAESGWNAVVEFAPEALRSTKTLWLPSRNGGYTAFAMMEKIKRMFDPQSLLNRSRLYGRL